MKRLLLNYCVLILTSLQFITVELKAQAQIILNQPNQGGTHIATESIVLADGFTSANGFHALIIPTSNCIPLQSTPTISKAHVITWTPRISGLTNVSTLSSRPICEVNQSIQYLDGLGRPLQLVETRANPDGSKDLITITNYDQFGREKFKYLPYTAGGVHGSFRQDALVPSSGVHDFYNPQGSSGDQLSNGIPRIPSPFSETQFEASTLNRTFQKGGPGDPWQLASGHTIRNDYSSNNQKTNPVLSDFRGAKLFRAQIQSNTVTRNLTEDGWYPEGTLAVNISKNENWVSGRAGTEEEFIDRDGRIILKRTWESETSPLSTYYVYDDLGNLCFVLTPGSNPDGSTAITTQVLNNFCFQYSYDHRNRQIEKQVPGKGKEEIVYNKLDQVVLSRDAEQLDKGKWLFNKYDAQGRLIITGIVSSTASREDWQNDVNNQLTLFEKRDDTNVANTNTGYSDQTLPLHSTTNYQVNQYLTISYFDDYNFFGNNFGHPQSGQRLDVHGLATGNKTNVLGTSNMLLDVNYYDTYGRLVETRSQNYVNGNDIVTSVYNFTGQTVLTKRVHSGYNNQSVSISKRYEYDHVGRKINTYQRIGNEQSPEVLLATLIYNELGQVREQILHNGLYPINYTYNSRGWLKTKTSSLFSFQLKYEEGNTPQYNGNISEQNWGTSLNYNSKSFSYTYDQLSRLMTASSPGMNETVHGYDAMSNMTGLTREGQSGTYQYIGNRLQKIINGGLATNEYYYDLNGNVTTDGRINKLITYNILNLPTSYGSGINFLYDAQGKKLRKTSTDIIDYVDGIRYLNGVIEFVSTDFGVARKSGSNYSYEYFLADHLGNTRASIQYNQNNNQIEAFQYENYFAFGLRSTPSLVSANSTQFLYNGKELQDELGQYDYGARFYDPVIGRWSVIDPLVELYQEDTSPYIYVLNNPIRLTDPDGRYPFPYDSALPFLNGVGRGIATGFKGTLSFLKEGAWKAETWKGMGNLSLGMMLKNSPGSYANLAAFDAAYGTNTLNAVLGFESQIAGGVDKFVNGDAGQKGEVVGQVLYAVAESVALSKGAGVVSNGIKAGKTLSSAINAAETVTNTIKTTEVVKTTTKAAAAPLKNISGTLDNAANLARNQHYGPNKNIFRRLAQNAQDVQALAEAEAGMGRNLNLKLGDPRYQGWEKWHHSVGPKGSKSVVHYLRDPQTGFLTDFKFK
ncbi:DUF6443 domain-containing protein [Pedobacter chitinilyticus]|uniref:RHS repeat-associated core domain-containing protein n=1 Tax=Pedobacter chitinilyticus TaxID=2233776 RepID=A0A3S3PS52_9SPHI|nr:DUF6443 domain-containing protein [Pedobacter chitinilyticus]RWU03949.1 RHS repeat-associated core domain-containing protein [Pedobacter chitinilyticus]